MHPAAVLVAATGTADTTAPELSLRTSSARSFVELSARSSQRSPAARRLLAMEPEKPRPSIAGISSTVLQLGAVKLKKPGVVNRRTSLIVPSDDPTLFSSARIFAGGVDVCQLPPCPTKPHLTFYNAARDRMQVNTQQCTFPVKLGHLRAFFRIPVIPIVEEALQLVGATASAHAIRDILYLAHYHLGTKDELEIPVRKAIKDDHRVRSDSWDMLEGLSEDDRRLFCRIYHEHRGLRVHLNKVGDFEKLVNEKHCLVGGQTIGEKKFNLLSIAGEEGVFVLVEDRLKQRITITPRADDDFQDGETWRDFQAQVNALLAHRGLWNPVT